MVNVTIPKRWYEEVKDCVKMSNPHEIDECGIIKVEVDVEDMHHFNLISRKLGWIKEEPEKFSLDKYLYLKSVANQAYGRFDANPTEQNSMAYGIAVEELRDYCTELVDTMAYSAPGMFDMINKLQVGGSHD